MPPIRTPARWAGLLALIAAGGVMGCESSLSVQDTGTTWGFVYLDATLPSANDPHVAPRAQFFKANISGVPNASITTDTCTDVAYTPTTDVGGVTFMDAGEQLTVSLGGQDIILPRTPTTDGSVYQLAGGSSVSFHPGDSVAVTIPGAVGGFPASTIRGKTAEAFTFAPVSVPTGTNEMQLTWSQGDDANSAMIVELRYGAAGSGGAITRELVCPFADDGSGTIPFEMYSLWTDQTNTTRDVIATRLRTSFGNVTNGILEVISTYQVVPTLQTP